MATGIHGKSTRVYVNGYNLSTSLQSISSPASADVVETTPFNTSDKTYISGGAKSGTLTFGGLWAGSTVQTDYVLNAALGGTTAIWCYYPAGDSTGSVGRGFKSKNNSYEVTAPVAGVVSISGGGQLTGTHPDIVKVLQPLTALNTSGVSASLDNVTETNNGANAYAHFTACSTHGCKVTLQHSCAGSTWDDLITFSTQKARGALWGASTGTLVKSMTRAARVFTAGGSATLHVALARK
ncbi:MAG: hypothetical protein WC359_15045 [Dehalococcoidia bacterium]